MGVHVPQDVIFNHILPRVPTKSICRFKGVSKEWHSFLMSDMFKNKHNRHYHENNLKLLVLSVTKTSLELRVCEGPPLGYNGLAPSICTLPLFEDTNPHDGIDILTSFHGLVCLGILNSRDAGEYSDLILCNPVTNEYKRLSKYNPHKVNPSSRFGLYYSSCEDDYKLLVAIKNIYCCNVKVCIYSLKSDSWRKVDIFEHTRLIYHGRWSRSTYLNENLYFLEQHSNRRLSSVIRFDTNTERFSMIETPYVDDNPNACDYFATILVKRDCIHVCVKYDIKISCDSGFGRKTCIELWKLDENGNMKEVVTYQLRQHDYNHIISYLNPFHLMKNGNWLMRGSSYKHKFYKVNFKKKKHIKGKGKDKGNIYDHFENAKVRLSLYGSIPNNNIVAEEVRYTETFVSPNRYMK